VRGLDRIGWPWLGRYEPIPSLAGFRPVIGDRGMVSSPHATASTIGLGVLQSGGNAVDAAIATSAALAVTCPMQCGPGGDAFWLVSAPDGKLSALDASGRCPSRADASRLRADGFATIGPRSPYSVTVPGAVSGWTKAHDAFGSKTLAELIEPAAALAERGVFVSRHILTSFLTAQSELVAKGALHLWSADDRVPELYSRMKQVRLAAALRSIAASGGRALYDGHLAEAIVRAVQNVGGWLGADDLAGHQADWIAPISGRFRELTVFTTPPSTQGFSLLAALAFVEGAAPSKLDPFDPDTVHLMIEAVAAALADRDSNNGDRDCLAAAVNSLWSTARVDAFVQQFSSRRCNVPSPVTRRVTKGDTAHLAVLDRNGMAVSLIQSLFFDFGPAFRCPREASRFKIAAPPFISRTASPAHCKRALARPVRLFRRSRFRMADHASSWDAWAAMAKYKRNCSFSSTFVTVGLTRNRRYLGHVGTSTAPRRVRRSSWKPAFRRRWPRSSKPEDTELNG